LLEPKYLIGVGAYAEKCLIRICKKEGIDSNIGKILHPSPASPAANKGWPHKAIEQLIEIGIW
jgi:single-strand selective monofunctional uracil DNA glycosylase